VKVHYNLAYEGGSQIQNAAILVMRVGGSSSTVLNVAASKTIASRIGNSKAIELLATDTIWLVVYFTTLLQ
jgi:hypothetical protein